MREAILEKLNLEINKGIDTEPKVVYFLVEIRKFIDGQDPQIKEKYSNLYFFCDWVVHIELDRTPAKKILNRFELLVEKHRSLKKISNMFISSELNFYMFIDLKKELRGFLEENNLPSDLLMKAEKWSIFRELLVEVLKDSPMINHEGEVSMFSFVTGPDNQTRFRVQLRGKKGSFKITLKDVTRQFMRKTN